MEIDELPQFDPNVDYREILPIHQKRTITFLNHFISNTVSFLNGFAESCESRLMQFEYKLQRVEASLLILESQLSSIPDLSTENALSNPVTSTPTEGNTSVSLDLPDISNEDTTPEETHMEIAIDSGVVASKDPRFIKYFKMVQFGVPVQVVQMKMGTEGLDPTILERPNAVIPGYVPEPELEEHSSSSS